MNQVLIDLKSSSLLNPSIYNWTARTENDLLQYHNNYRLITLELKLQDIG